MATLYWCGLSKQYGAATPGFWGTAPPAIVFAGSRTLTTLTVTTVYGGVITPGIVGVGTVLYNNAGAASGTITAQLTGTAGGAGTYTTSASGTITANDLYGFAPGVASAAVPTSTDDVVFGAPSRYSGSVGPTFTSNSGFSVQSFTTNAGSNGSVYTIAGTSPITVSGNVSLSTGTIWTHTAAFNLTNTLTNCTLNTNGTAISSNVVVNSTTGTITLASNFGQNNTTTNGGSFTFTSGTIDLAGYAWNCGTFVTGTGTATTRNLAFGSTGIVNVTSVATANVINVSAIITPSILVLTGTNPTFALTGSTGVGTRTISWTGTSWAGTSLLMPSFKVTGGTDAVTMLVATTATGNLNLLDLTGFAGSFTYNANTTYTVYAYNSIIVPSGATAQAAASQVISINFQPTSGTYSFGTGSLTTNGGTITFPATGTAVYNQVGAPTTTSNLVGGSATGSINFSGTFTTQEFGTSGSPILGANLGSATIILLDFYVASPFNAGTSTITIGFGPTAVISASGFDLYNFTISGSSLTATFNVKSINTFTSFPTFGSQTLKFASNCTFGTFNYSSVSGNSLAVLTSDTTTQRTLTKSTPWTLDNSTDSGNNTGLTFLGSGTGNNSYLNVSYINGVVTSTATGNMFLMF
jgi:hypothetical protein